MVAESRPTKKLSPSNQLAQKIADMMPGSKNQQLIDWAEKRDTTLGQPDAGRLKKARKFANSCASVSGARTLIASTLSFSSRLRSTNMPTGP